MEVHEQMVLPCLRFQADCFPRGSVGQLEDNYRIGRARKSGTKEGKLSICDVSASCLLQMRYSTMTEFPRGSLQGKDGQFLVCLIQDLLATMDVEEVFRDDDNVMEEEDTDEITEV